MDNDKKYCCMDCNVMNCIDEDGVFPSFCTNNSIDDDFLSESLKKYDEMDNRKIMLAAAEVEAEHYLEYNRIQEIVCFAKKIDAKKIGIASCVGLLKESRILAKILKSNGFEVIGLACKAGLVKKTDMGISKECNSTGINMCNPIMQAEFFNREKTDLNIVCGLCVGHDSLFYRYSDAAVTTAVVKDRVLGHNPAAALYTADTYYESKFFK